jgi:hypothetical protein
MKAPIAAFALLSFVAASTIPYVAQAQTPASKSERAAVGKKTTKKKAKAAETAKTANKVPAPERARAEPLSRPDRGM